MNREQAGILHTMIGELIARKADVHQIGNKEYVVRVSHEFDWFYLWSRDDWEAHKHRWKMWTYTLEGECNDNTRSA